MKLVSAYGIRVGDTVRIKGWRRANTIDYRIVEEMWEAQCQLGVMVRLNEPLHNGSTAVSISWVDELQRDHRKNPVPAEQQ